MSTFVLLLVIVALFAFSYWSGRGKALVCSQAIGGLPILNSLPFYYGMLAVFWCAIPCLVLVLFWSIFDESIIQKLLISQLPEDIAQIPSGDMTLLINVVNNIASGISTSADQPLYIQDSANYLRKLRESSNLAMSVIALSLAVCGLAIAWVKINPELRARYQVENVFKLLLLLCSCIAILTTVGIVLSVVFEAVQFFRKVPVSEFLFGLHWSPQTAIREGQVGGSGSFGAVPLFVGTLLISGLAMIVAVPTGLMSAIYLSEYARKQVRNWVKPLLEVLDGIPTVVYGCLEAISVDPTICATVDLVE